MIMQHSSDYLHKDNDDLQIQRYKEIATADNDP